MKQLYTSFASELFRLVVCNDQIHQIIAQLFTIICLESLHVHLALSLEVLGSCSIENNNSCEASIISCFSKMTTTWHASTRLEIPFGQCLLKMPTSKEPRNTTVYYKPHRYRSQWLPQGNLVIHSFTVLPRACYFSTRLDSLKSHA